MVTQWVVVKTLNGSKEIVERNASQEKAVQFAEDCNVFARHERAAKRPVYEAVALEPCFQCDGDGDAPGGGNCPRCNGGGREKVI